MNIASVLSLRDLEYLVAVAEIGHFGKAAQACHVSQPALSAQIKKVEDLLGVEIFERSNRRVAITQVGENVVRQAKIVLGEAQKIGDLTQTNKSPFSLIFRLGAIASLGPYYIPSFLGTFRKKFPHGNLFLKEGLTDGLLADLREGQLDAVLASPTFKDDQLRVIPLFWEPFLIAIPREHPLAEKTAIQVSDLRPGEMVLLEEGHCLTDQTLSFCAPSRRKEVQQFQATSLETLRHLVASGLGYSLMPAMAAQGDQRFSRLLEYREFKEGTVGRVVCLVARARSSRMSEVEKLAEFLKANLPSGVRKLPGKA